MHSSYIIVDNFYANPYDVYEFALKQPFACQTYNATQTNQYTLNCVHTLSFSSLMLRELFQNIISPIAGNITRFDLSSDNNTHLNGSFQHNKLDTKPMINNLNNGDNTWIGIIFLDPNADVTVGVSLCKHISTSSNEIHNIKELNHIDCLLKEKERFDYTKWDVVDYIGSVFNRLVCFRASNYHRYDFNIVTNKFLYSTPEKLQLYQFFIFNTEQ